MSRRRTTATALTLGVGLFSLVGLVSACSALLGDASYRCTADDIGACPSGMTCALPSGVCVAEGAGDDGGEVSDSSFATEGATDPGDEGASGDDDAAPLDARAGDAGEAGSASDAFAAPPVCDGVVTAGEYGSTVNGTNQVQTTTGQTWYATWDDGHLYVAVTGVALGDGTVVYLDALAGGVLDAGARTGFADYDGVTVSPLPFPAQLVFYAKAGGSGQSYTEYRLHDESGGWSDAHPGIPTVCGTDPNTNAREIVLPWSALGGGGDGGLPPTFRFLAFATDVAGGSGAFAQVPATNPASTPSAWPHAYDVASTSPGGSAPFGAPY